ncbi:non-homologous end-joining factor 1-like isoform X1 [Cyprinus carpio]|uniref:Non-homologous end-joining factor 1 n=1 Tax=Cyprinus carpio TaxID=7962 RepID=A0A9Q9WDE5_CYPCA|nr:non-homologous end-joining factor 1-like isoform X1 [Cyprinus carpio]
MDEHGGNPTNGENKHKTYNVDSKNENEETTEETEDNLDMLVPHEVPTGVLTVHIKDCKVFPNIFYTKDFQFFLRISVGGKEKCTKLQSNKDARGGKADFSLCFDEWKYFSIQIPEQNSRAVNPNQIMVELLFFEPAARDPKPMGSAFFNVLKVLNESIVTHQFNVMLNKQIVCKLDVEMAITYGSFGYGHSHQVKHPERTVEEQVEKSLFPRCPSPDNLQDPDYNEKNTQSDIISHLIQRDSQGGRDSSDLMNQIEKRGRLCTVCCGEMETGLFALPWVPVNIGGSDLLAKAWFGDTQYRVLLSDLNTVWEEEMTTDDIQSRAQDLNKRLRAPTHAFFSHLCSVARPCFSSEDDDQISTAHVTLEQHGDNLTVKLKSELAGLPFYWEFRCTTTPVGVVCRHLVRPLLAVSRVLQRQVEDLAALLARKDAEIQDYQENGAVLSRARLQTEPFEVHRYRENFFTQIVPQMGVTLDSVGFDSELQALYMAVSSGKTGQKRKRSPDSSPAAEDKHVSEHHQHITDVPTGSSLASQEQNDVKAPSGRPQVTDSKQAVTLPSTVGSEERSTSRPKKKKAVGLFR